MLFSTCLSHPHLGRSGFGVNFLPPLLQLYPHPYPLYTIPQSQPSKNLSRRIVPLPRLCCILLIPSDDSFARSLMIVVINYHSSLPTWKAFCRKLACLKKTESLFSIAVNVTYLAHINSLENILHLTDCNGTKTTF